MFSFGKRFCHLWVQYHWAEVILFTTVFPVRSVGHFWPYYRELKLFVRFILANRICAVWLDWYSALHCSACLYCRRFNWQVEGKERIYPSYCYGVWLFVADISQLQRFFSSNGLISGCLRFPCDMSSIEPCPQGLRFGSCLLALSLCSGKILRKGGFSNV